MVEINTSRQPIDYQNYTVGGGSDLMSKTFITNSRTIAIIS